MSKSTLSFTAQRVAFDSLLPVQTVISRMDEALGSQNSGLGKLAPLLELKSKVDLVTGLNRLLPENGEFFHFLTFRHNEWLSTCSGKSNPVAHVYIFGNPLMAQAVLDRDILTGLHIPPRLLVLEKPTGTQILYLLPSSYLNPNDADPELEETVRSIDDKLEKLVLSVLDE